MNIDEIMQKSAALHAQLRVALSTMDKKDTIFQLHTELKQLQDECPHYSAKYNYTMADNKCPYCGKNME